MRQSIRFNQDWKFLRGDPAEAQSPEFDDSAWRPVTLPHDWSIEGPFDAQWASATGYLPGGIGWYRKTFPTPEAAQNGKAYLYFDGVYCNSDVWINGRHLGKRPNGFVSFQYDLTSYLAPSGLNVVAVRVDHSQYADARWYTGSGINRNVSLILTGLIQIKQWGVFVTTPVVTADRAEVQVEVTVENHAPTPSEVEIENTLWDSQGRIVATARASAVIAAAGEVSLRCALAVLQPKLWSVAQPELYVLQTVLRGNGQALDEIETPVGIRSFRFDPNDGFFLNEQPLKLKGVCVHDDAGALGTAVPPKVWERRLRILKEAGVNAIRMAHNPHMPELYDLCDRMGLLVQDEAFDEWEQGKRKWIAGWNVGEAGTDGPHSFFAEWGETDLRDMILRDRNHPSIIMWSIGNEIDYPNDPYTHEILDTGTNPQISSLRFHPEKPHADRLGVIARRLAEVVKRSDVTRPVTAALAAALVSNETGFAEALDLVGYNYQEYLYAEDHARFPDHLLYGSENGMRWEAWEAVAANPYISAQFLWTGIDYLGEARSWPSRSSGAGLLDLAGLPKPEYYYRQSLWAAQPMVHLGTSPAPEGEETASLWRHRRSEPVWSGTEGVPMRVCGFTNCEAAELFLNGRSCGVKRLADALDHVLWWEIPYAPGTLTLNGLNGSDIAVTQSLQTSGPPKKLVAETDMRVLSADGEDIAHVVVTVADADGIPVYRTDAEVTWTLTGPARLRGLESGDTASHEDYQASRRKLFHGRLLGYLQATETAGTVTLRLSAPGLEEAVVVLQSKKAS